jgi:hypothetical protein
MPLEEWQGIPYFPEMQCCSRNEIASLASPIMPHDRIERFAMAFISFSAFISFVE